jgi:hypothetical protein
MRISPAALGLPLINYEVIAISNPSIQAKLKKSFINLVLVISARKKLE